MEPYLFFGVVLPERAQLSLQFSVRFSHSTSGVGGDAKASIILNQMVVHVNSKHDWDIFDLRNVVKNIIQNYLAMVGYLAGISYDFEITRILNQSRGIDYVFGIDIPCLAERNKGIDMQDSLTRLRDKTIGENGIFLSRCFADLVSSMKHADDTGFYCYRAIESLRHHCAALHGLTNAGKAKQWDKFREISGSTEETLRSIKLAADPLRHGEASGGSAQDRTKLLTDTWDVVDSYLKGV
ncbi:hypothetical protein [Burkholderia sp. Ac-20392]|uniref:hypothetical protein n=1 Tax=Burkholderia sp. Ac-20392 TaxID=2703905 RepID=UPI00197F6B8F|nr:hypothetical protein [Burkholderia sp. Ac-20392]MBN3797216.1 hypothetical protein [Burkholderia sp. Ac-20392]